MLTIYCDVAMRMSTIFNHCVTLSRPSLLVTGIVETADGFNLENNIGVLDACNTSLFVDLALILVIHLGRNGQKISCVEPFFEWIDYHG